MANLKTISASIFAGASALALSACSVPEVGGQCDVTGDGTVAVFNNGARTHEAEIQKEEPNGRIYAYPTVQYNGGELGNERITQPNMQIRVEPDGSCFFDSASDGETFRIRGGVAGTAPPAPMNP